MTELTVAAEDIQVLREALLGGNSERCAVLYAAQTERSTGSLRLLVREVEFPGDADYVSSGVSHATLTPAFVARISKRAKREKLSIVFVHSHPGEQAPLFSAVDDFGEEQLANFLAHRHPDVVHAAMVVSAGGLRARQLGRQNEIRVLSLGDNRDLLFEPDQGLSSISKVFDRQVRAFGGDGQRELGRLCVAIVGLGGTGSIVAQQLAHLGVRNFILVDPDVVEETNLNRVSGAIADDIGEPKVKVASRYIHGVAPDASIESIVGDIVRVKIARSLLDADLIFGCTDSHGSRAILQQVAYQYCIPCVDMGTTITVSHDAVEGIFGRVQLLAPGLACFTCSGLLDSAEVRRDMMNEFERKLDPYIQGAREPAPAVMSINGTVASLAVTMFMAIAIGIPSRGRHILYNGKATTLRVVQATPRPNCFVCSRSGAFARGNSMAPFGRLD